MSTYQRWTKHPKTKKWHLATWIDNYFGNHHYGVQFTEVFDPEKKKLETSEDKPIEE